MALQAFLTYLIVLNFQLIVSEIESYASLARTSQVFLTTNANGLTNDPKLMSQEQKRFWEVMSFYMFLYVCLQAYAINS